MKKVLLLTLIIITGCTRTDIKMKHPLDKSESRTLILENGLKVYLISDPSFNVSAASVAVEVGSLDNPKEREGLAHFLEHMLFLGTEKFPDVDEYSTYLKNYGGYSNAYTAPDHTNYQFQVLPDGFEGALDRFSQFFISPLFTEEYTEREVNAVNSEHQKNIMNDYRRLYRISNLFAKEGHPEQKFGTGNLETLGNTTRDELLKFYKKYYSSNRMGLALLSTHSLDDMEKLANQYFSGIKNYNKPKNTYDPNFVEEKNTFRLIQVEPVKDIRELSLTFPLPGIRQLYKSKPGRQFGSILGHEGEGSLLSYLKKKGWASTLSAGAGSTTNDYASASVRVGLTKEGLSEYKQVLKATMSYIDLMRKSDRPDYIFNELKAMSNLEEIYSNKGEGMWRATELANEVLMYPIEDAGRINYIYDNKNSKDYNDLLSHIKPQNMLVSLTAKGVKVDKTEHFYQTKYSYSEDLSFFEELKTSELISDFHLPNSNPFIPKKASVPGREYKEKVYPELVNEGKGLKLYFGQDHQFLRPKGVISLKVLLPKDKMNLEHRVFSRFYTACVNESLNEISYPAKEAGLNYGIKEGYEGIYIDVSGYTESSIILFETVLNQIINFSISDEQFDAIKDKILRNYNNFPLSDAHQQTREISPEIYNNIKFSWEESLVVAEKTTLENIKKYSKSLYEKTFVEAMVYGDFEKDQAEKVVEMFNNKTGTVGIEREETFELKHLQLEESEDIQYIDDLLVNNSCFFRQYEIGEDSPKTRAMSMVIDKVLQQPFYTEMRTNQQLGYIVWSYTRNIKNRYFLNFLIQSGVYDGGELDKRADKFIYSSAENEIVKLDENTFKQIIESCIEELEKKPMSILEKATKLKTAIFEYDINYFRDEETVDALNQINKENLLSVFNEVVSPKSRKMINIVTFAENHKNISNMKSSFTDLEKWKSSKIYK
jgi:insulysin